MMGGTAPVTLCIPMSAAPEGDEVGRLDQGGSVTCRSSSEPVATMIDGVEHVT